LALLEESRRINQTGLLSTIQIAAIELSPIFFLAIPWLFWTAFRGCVTSILAAPLFVFQCGIIAWKLPHDFRFLGGLQYVVVIAAALTLAKPRSALASSSNNNWAGVGKWLVSARIQIVLVLVLPWLTSQMYYARPFAAVASGLESREVFLERYVALTRDFQILDAALPNDAILYCDTFRLSNFYSPRPVLLTLLDLHGDKPIFRLRIKPKGESEPIDDKWILHCNETFYRNDRAVIETYRTPGKDPTIGRLTIERCRVISTEGTVRLRW
jgi:hypothetical protein